MSEKGHKQRVLEFFAGVFGVTADNFRQLAAPELPLEERVASMSGVIDFQNQPEFWADAPWRLEPDQDQIPVSFHVRDTNAPCDAGPWRLDALRVDQRLADGSWHPLATFPRASVPYVDAQGNSLSEFWVMGTSIPLAALQGVGRGDSVHLRVRFEGGRPAPAPPTPAEIHLDVWLATHALPQGRAAQGLGPRRWFYGDTHYHSGYTNDIKEFGGVLPEARKAAKAIGLDWLIVTDHSCDLDEVDPDAAGKRRWDRLKADIASSQISDDTFRCILGEEITLLSGSGKPVHMLAFGALEEMIEGAFLSARSKSPEMELVRRAIETILAAGSGYPDDIPQRLFGTIHPLHWVLEHLPPGTLAFAAHPYDVAQVPPGRWGKADLEHPRLTGYEFWNGRIRVSAGHTDDPFSLPDWQNQAKLQKADRARIEKLQKHARERWDPQLQRGAEGWSAQEASPAWRPVMLGGSDAHCDLNYHVGWAWDYRKFDVSDGAFARVRTVVHMPDHPDRSVPTAEQILAAIQKGCCVVTDGPIVEFSMEQGDHRAHMGDVLPVAGPPLVRARLLAHSTPELGSVQQATVVSYWKGQPQPQRTVVRVGTPVLLDMGGTQGYLRVEATTAGPTGERFCCFTNPVWVRAEDMVARKIEVSLT